MLKQLGENAIAAGLVVLTNVNNIIPTPNPMMEYIKGGTTQIVAEDLVRYYNGEGSLILNLDYRNLFDRIAFASGFIYALNVSGVTPKAIQLVQSTSPFPDMVNGALVDGALIMANRTTSDLMDASPAITQTPLVYLNHISLLLG